jgi:hypothetical protein
MAGGSWEILGTGMKAVINKKKKKKTAPCLRQRL